jgi:hypothetical protein
MKKFGILLKLLILLAMAGAALVGCSSPAKPVTDENTASIVPLDRAKTVAVKANLSSDRDLASQGIKATVINQECTLEGTVPSEELKKRAEDLAMKVEGITKVINKIEVKP